MSNAETSLKFYLKHDFMQIFTEIEQHWLFLIKLWGRSKFFHQTMIVWIWLLSKVHGQMFHVYLWCLVQVKYRYVCCWNCQLFKYIKLLNRCIIITRCIICTIDAFESLETCWSGSQGCPLRFRWVCIKAFFCKHSQSCSLSSVFAHFCMLSLCASFWRLMLDILDVLYLTQEMTKFFKIP